MPDLDVVSTLNSTCQNAISMLMGLRTNVFNGLEDSSPEYHIASLRNMYKWFSEYVDISKKALKEPTLNHAEKTSFTIFVTDLSELRGYFADGFYTALLLANGTPTAKLIHTFKGIRDLLVIPYELKLRGTPPFILDEFLNRYLQRIQYASQFGFPSGVTNSLPRDGAFARDFISSEVYGCNHFCNAHLLSEGYLLSQLKKRGIFLDTRKKG